jgi:seryl-tRNA synthetase
MLDIETVRSHPQRVKEAVRAKYAGNPDEIDALVGAVDELLNVDEERRSHITEMQEKQARQNDLSSEIGKLKREGKDEEAEQRIEKTSQLKDEIDDLEEQVDAADARQRAAEPPAFQRPGGRDGGGQRGRGDRRRQTGI